MGFHNDHRTTGKYKVPTGSGALEIQDPGDTGFAVYPREGNQTGTTASSIVVYLEEQELGKGITGSPGKTHYEVSLV